MPKLSDTMTEGVVAEWHKKVGDSVSAGDVLAEIETDKATMEFESFQDGVLLHIGVEKGKSAEVDSILAILGEKGEDISDLLKGDGSAKSTSEPKAEKKESESVKNEEKSSEHSQDAKKADKEKQDDSAEKEAPKSTSAQADKSASPAQPVRTSSEGENGRLKASPLARKLASEKGIDLYELEGSGEGGRIVRRDIENYQPRPAATVSATVAGKESYHEEPVSQMRKTIARRLAESKFTSPHFYLTIEIDMDNAVAIRKQINETIDPDKISFNDLVIKAAAEALRKHPKVNSSWLGDKIRYNDHVHIGVAVAVDEGLLVPVVRFADGKTLVEIGAEVRDFASKARNKKLQPKDWEGNTFTISNLGMFGIDEFTAIINPPDSCIMAIGSIVQKPVVKKGQIVVGNVMKVTLSCDHRSVDGAVGSAFLQTFRQYMENPVLMIAR